MLQLTRRDVGYTVISRLEEIVRAFLADKLLVFFANFMDGIPTGVIEKVKDRSIESTCEDPAELLEHTDFPDLMEIATYKDAYTQYFPNPSLSKRDFQTLMGTLYDLRCRIAHIKSNFSSIDLDRLIGNARQLAESLQGHGNEFLRFTQRLEEDPNSLVVRIPSDFISEQPDPHQVLNNVPVPDYEYDGGFVGREEDIKKISSLLEGTLHRVITISGAGGVGKTALALKVIHEKFLKAMDSPFDGVVWLSAKEKRLSDLGIEDVEPTVKNYEELLDTISTVMGLGPLSTSASGLSDIQTLFDLHKSILIALDNLETITDQRIIEFILDCHPNAKFLITSRKGLGQVERRVELRQLKEKEAVHLFRVIAREKKLESLSHLDDDTVKTYVKRISYYPLAIKWLIGHVALGKDIHTLIDMVNEASSDISSFCFAQIYQDLSPDAKNMLCALSCFDEPTSAGVLKFLVNVNQVVFEDAIHELILVSLVISEQFKDELSAISSRYGLLSLTRGYARQQLDNEPTQKKAIQDRLRSINAMLWDAERKKRHDPLSLYNLGALTEEEKVAATITTIADQKYKSGRYEEALEDYKQAREIAPRFAFLYRNWGVMEAQERHHVVADKLLEKAISLSEKDPVIWLTWGNVKRKNDKPGEALRCYEKARELSPDDPTILHSLGTVKTHLGEYAEADQLFRQALALNSNKEFVSRKQEVFNRRGLALNLKRWAEVHVNDRNFPEAEKTLKEALGEVQTAIGLDPNDKKSAGLFREIALELGLLCNATNQPILAIAWFQKAIKEGPTHYRDIKLSVKAKVQISRILLIHGEVDRAKQYANENLRLLSQQLNNSGLKSEVQQLITELYEEGILEGTIIRVSLERAFAIIASASSPEDTYLAIFSEFAPPLIVGKKDLVGTRVRFAPGERKTNTGKNKIAMRVHIVYPKVHNG